MRNAFWSVLTTVALCSGCGKPVAKGESGIRVEVSGGLSPTPAAIRQIKAVARTACSQPVREIFVGWKHGTVGAFARYDDEVIDSYAVCRTLHIPFWSDEKRTDRGYPVGQANLGKPEMRMAVQRVFRLGETTLHLPVADQVSYDQAAALLKCLEAGTFRIRDGARTDDLERREDPDSGEVRCVVPLQTIGGLGYDKTNRTVRVLVSTGTDSLCKWHEFAPLGEVYEFVSTQMVAI